METEVETLVCDLGLGALHASDMDRMGRRSTHMPYGPRELSYRLLCDDWEYVGCSEALSVRNGFTQFPLC